MARRCEICGKGTVSGYSLTFSHIRNKRQFRANVQRIRARVDGRPRRVHVCTTCLRSGRVSRAR